jgi:hypothetical protein
MELPADRVALDAWFNQRVIGDAKLVQERANGPFVVISLDDL